MKRSWTRLSLAVVFAVFPILGLAGCSSQPAVGVAPVQTGPKGANATAGEAKSDGNVGTGTKTASPD